MRLVDPSGRPLPSKEDEETANEAKRIAGEFFLIVDANELPNALNGMVTCIANIALRMNNSKHMEKFLQDFIAATMNAVGQAIQLQQENEKAHKLLAKGPRLHQ